MSAEAGTGKGMPSWGVGLAVVLVGAFMAILDASIVNIAIPGMMNAFGVSTDQVEWVVTIYMLALGVVVPLSGWLGDHLGYKRLYILSLVVFTIGSLLAGIAPTLNFLIAARIIQAVGGGMIMPTTMAMIYRLVPMERIGTAMGFWGMSLLVAPAIGPTLGGYLVEYVDWRLIFTINLPIGVFGVLAALAWLPHFETHPAGKIDWPGVFSSSGGLFALLFALTEGRAWGWTSEPIVLLLYASGALLWFFVWWELRAPQPLLDLRVFRYPSFTASIILGVIISVAMFSGVFFIPLFLQTIRGLGALQTGLLMMPGALATGIMMPFSGRMYDRIGPRPLAFVGILIMAYTTYLFSHLSPDIATGRIVLWSALRGMGMGLMMMPSMTAGMSVVPPHLVSRASAIQNIAQRVSSSFGIAVLTTVMIGRQAVYSSALAVGVRPDSPTAVAFLQHITGSLRAIGLPVEQAQRLAVGFLYGQVQQQALVQAMDDLFIIMAIVAVLGLLPIFFLRKGSGGGTLGRVAGAAD